MALISPLLELLLLFMNVFQTFKTLKPPVSSRNKLRPSIRAVTQRKRDMKGLLTMWIVWSCLFAYERTAERLIRVFIPFYGEIKTILLLLLTLTRARSSEPIYLHFIRPTIKPYVATLDPFVDALTGACDFVLFLVSIPLEQVFGPFAPTITTDASNHNANPTANIPEIVYPDIEPNASRTRPSLRSASSRATLSSVRTHSGDRRPSVLHPRRLQSESAANITSQQFWYPPSPAQSSPESRNSQLPNLPSHIPSASDSATLHLSAQAQWQRDYLPHGVQVHNSLDTHESSDESTSSDESETLETPRRTTGMKKRNLSQPLLPEEEESSDENNTTLRTPMPSLQLSRQISENPEERGLGGDPSDSSSSVGFYSAVLSTNDNASSLCTGASSSSSDSDSNGSLERGSPRIVRGKQMTSGTIRASARVGLNKNTSGTLAKSSAHPRRRQPPLATRTMSLSQQQLARMSMSSAAADDENTDGQDEHGSATTSSNEQSEFGALRQSHPSLAQKADRATFTLQANGSTTKDGKSKQPEDKTRPGVARRTTITRPGAATRTTSQPQAKRSLAPSIASRTSSRLSRES